MNEKTKIYTQNELYENEIDTDAYELNTEAGEFVGMLKLKAWTSKPRTNGHGKSIRAFLELDVERKVIALIQPFRTNQIATISAAEIGELIRLRFETSSSGLVFLAELEVLSMPEEIK